MWFSSNFGNIFGGLWGTAHSWSGMLLFVRSALNLMRGLLGSDAADAFYGNWPCCMPYTFDGVSRSSLGPLQVRP